MLPRGPQRLPRRFALGAMALVALAAIPTVVRAQTVWEMPTEYPASAIPGEGVAMFARLVTERSGGRLTIRPSFDASSGIKSADVIGAVQSGKVQLGDAFAGSLGAAYPLLGLSSLPFLATSVDQARKLTDIARPAYETLLGTYGQRLLYTTPWPPSGIWSKEPLASLQALKSLSIRTYDGTSTEVMKEAGANAFNISFADAMPRLKDGSVNAVLSSGDGGAGRRLWDILTHFTEVNYAVPLSIAVINSASLDALPADLKSIVQAAAAETEQRQWTIIRSRLAENYDRMRANGVTIRTDVPPELASALTKAARAPVEAWRVKAGEVGSRLLDAYGRT